MAISSIQMFQNNGGNSIEGLLRAGPEAISNIMNQAISLGRSMADKQMAQEQDLLNMRQQENALAQRRAEQAQNVFADTMKFSRGVLEDNRDFAANREDAAFQRNRLTANDLFSQEMERRRLGLSEKKLGMASAEAEAERQREVAAAELFNDKYGGGGGEPALPGAGTTTEEIIPTSTDNPRIDEINKELDILRTPNGSPSRASLLLGGEPNRSMISNLEAERTAISKTPKGTVPEVRTLFTPAEEDGGVLPPRNELASVEAKLEMLEKPPEGASEKALTNFFEEKSLLEQRRKELTATGKPDTAKPPTSAAEGREIKALFKNKKVFPPPLGKKPTLEMYKDKPNGKKEYEINIALWEKQKAEAELYEKDKETNEMNSAFNTSEAEYVDKVPGLSAEEKEIRRRAYRFAKKELGGTGAGGSTTTGTGASDYVKSRSALLD